MEIHTPPIQFLKLAYPTLSKEISIVRCCNWFQYLLLKCLSSRGVRRPRVIGFGSHQTIKRLVVAITNVSAFTRRLPWRFFYRCIAFWFVMHPLQFLVLVSTQPGASVFILQIGTSDEFLINKLEYELSLVVRLSSE
jgi:hypothetical protein